ncbi:MAG: hypothetical protein RL095_1091 [Verrucomicrobiota bacterium]
MKTLLQLIAFALLFLIAPSIYAQVAKEPKVEVTVESLEIKELLNPEPSMDRIAKVNGTSKWQVLLAEYSVKITPAPGTKASPSGLWLDDLSVTWNLLAPGSVKGTLFRSSFTENYRGIKEGKNYACCLIHPTDVQRYLGDGKNLKDMVIDFQLRVNGVSKLLEKGRPISVFLVNGHKADKLPAGFTKETFQKEGMPEVKNLLISREQSPWEHAQQDVFPRTFRREN